MICSRCRRPMKSPAVISGSVALGPKCARLMGLAVGKRIAAPVDQAGQLPLFQTEQVAA